MIELHESQTKVSNAVQAFFDAQLALQKDFFAVATAGFQGAIALERASLKAAARAAETSMEYTKTASANVPNAVRNAIGVVPGVDAETAERLAKEAGTALATIQATSEKSASAAREAAAIATRQYETILADLETRGVETVKAAEAGMAQSTQAARDAANSALESAYAAATRATAAARNAQPTL